MRRERLWMLVILTADLLGALIHWKNLLSLSWAVLIAVTALLAIFHV